LWRAPLRDVAGKADSGAVHMITPLDPSTRRILVEEVAVIVDSASARDHFGGDVAAEDVHSLARNDSVIGCPGTMTAMP